ncbi:hypothetical protein ACFQQB_23460 [Nonomuraea rubra]|uniref:hypothetical protein n=1 Tax=Nonomuraea rubra TaxID=46180 RepID=UPI00361A4FBD
MRRPRALVLPTLPESALARLGEIADLTEVPARPSLGFTDEQLADLVIETGATVLITDGDQVRTSVLGLHLDVVASMGPPASVDLALAAERGVTVLHAPERDSEAVAELTLALLFAVSRNIVSADREVRRGGSTTLPSTRAGCLRRSATAAAGSPGARSASSAWAGSAGRCAGGARAWA